MNEREEGRGGDGERESEEREIDRGSERLTEGERVTGYKQGIERERKKKTG